MNWRKITFLIVGVLAVLSLPSFLEHVRWFIMGHVESVVVEGRWDLVAINAALFLAFLLPLAFRRKVEWKSMGIYTAFIVSLFVEMYGIPLTVYISSSVLSPLGSPPTQSVVFTFTFFGQSLAMTLWKVVGSAVSLVGMALVVVAWVQLYRSRQKGDLVTSGLYSYSRHPQYLGIIFITIGWFIHWPSILTLLMLPVLVYMYYKLALDEEEEVMESLEDPSKYKDYMSDTPRFI